MGSETEHFTTSTTSMVWTTSSRELELEEEEEEMRSRASATLATLRLSFPSYEAETPEHWLAEGLLSLSISRTLALLLMLMIGVSYFSCLIWFAIYRRTPSLQSPSNQLTLSLIMADLVMMTKSWIFVVNALHGGPKLGTAGCYAFGSLGTLAGLVQIWTITLISVERAVAVFHPLSRRKRMSKTQAKVFVIIIWIIAIFFSTVPFLGWSRFVSEAYMLACSFDTWSRDFGAISYFVTLIVLAYFVPLVVIVGCYSAIYITTHRARRNIVERQQRLMKEFREEEKRSRPDQSMSCEELDARERALGLSSAVKDCYAAEFIQRTVRTEKRLATMAVLIISIWVATWTPYALMSLMQELGFGHYIPPQMSLAAILLAKGSSIINTYVYGLRLPQFRFRLEMLFSEFPRLPRVQMPTNLASIFNSSAANVEPSRANNNENSNINLGNAMRLADIREEEAIEVAPVDSNADNTNLESVKKKRSVTNLKVNKRSAELIRQLSVEQAKLDVLRRRVEIFSEGGDREGGSGSRRPSRVDIGSKRGSAVVVNTKKNNEDDKERNAAVVVVVEKQNLLLVGEGCSHTTKEHEDI